MKSKEFIFEADIVSNIHNISHGDPSGWYVSGGCYEFAEALKLAFGKGAVTWTADSADGNDIHAFTEYNGKFYDINGEHDSPDDVISDGDYYYTPPIQYNNGSNGFADPANVKAIAKDLIREIR